jgi:tRNA(Ile)-lysidine synthase
MEDLLARVRRYASRYGLLLPGQIVVVGVSGGPDSLALLHLLRGLSPEMRLNLHVAHLDHGLRGASSEEDARFVADLAASWGLPCSIGQADVRSMAGGRSLEEAARLARYRFLAEVAARIGVSGGPAPVSGQAPAIAVGHNLDDQAETVLMHFLRGTGVAGLRGMLPRTPLSDYRLGMESEGQGDGEFWLVRPLLGIPRSEIETYCARHGLEPRFDRSNEDLTIYRNRLRHELLPLLEKHNPAIRRILAHTAEVMAGSEEILRAGLRAAWQEIALPGDEDEVLFDLARWRALPLGLQRAALREAIHRLRNTLRDIHWDHVERAVWLAREGKTGQSATLPAGLMLHVGYRCLRVAADGTPWRPDVPLVQNEIELTAPGVTSLGGGWRVIVRLEKGSQSLLEMVSDTDRGPHGSAGGSWEAWLDEEAVGPRLVLRPRRPGDRFLPQGLAGHSVALHEFMINQKIPRDARAGWPLLEGSRGLAWICGLRVDERAVVRADSRRVWHVRLERPSEGETSGDEVTE